MGIEREEFLIKCKESTIHPSDHDLQTPRRWTLIDTQYRRCRLDRSSLVCLFFMSALSVSQCVPVRQWTGERERRGMDHRNRFSDSLALPLLAFFVFVFFLASCWPTRFYQTNRNGSREGERVLIFLPPFSNWGFVFKQRKQREAERPFLERWVMCYGNFSCPCVKGQRGGI